MADDLQYAHAGGQTQTKDQYIAAVTKGPAHYESFTFSDVKIKLYGKAAVLTGFVDVKMVGQDPFRVRTLQVYTENNGQWQMSAHQSTRWAVSRTGLGRSEGIFFGGGGGGFCFA